MKRHLFIKQRLKFRLFFYFQEGGSSEKDKDVVQPFLGYSPSGKASGELVYVNYGQVEDFEQLKNLSVNVTGKIAIMRYGKIFRGNKVMLGPGWTITWEGPRSQ